MRGAAGGVVHLELYQSWQLPLDPEVPLVDFGVPVSLAPVVAVRVSPKRQLAVLSLLRADKTYGERVRQVRILGATTVLGKVNGDPLVPGRAAILPVGGIALAVIQPCRTSQHGCITARAIPPTGNMAARPGTDRKST